MKFFKYETNYKKRIYLKKEEVNGFEKSSEKKENNVINIYPEKKYQEILGFGGAITESSAYVFSKLPENIQNEFIKDYFSEEGINYNFCRTHINSCDFSLSTYSYSEKEDLSDFSIEHDKIWLIPLIKRAIEENSNLKLMATPWSPPRFMKTTNNMNLGGKLKEEYKQLWADYIVKYFEEYKKENISFDYMTIQNEPKAKQIWESCLFDVDEEADFGINYLAKNLDENKINTKIICWDHNKERVYDRAKAIFSKDKNNKIAGIGYHYYTGDHFGNLQLTRDEFPNKLLIHTEGCCGFSVKRRRRQIPNAEIYAHDIFGDLNNGANAYIDWNIILDYKGGPNHVLNNCYSPVIANFFNKRYTKNAAFYYIGHFSKFIKRGAKRIAFSNFSKDIEVAAFENPDNKKVIVVMNVSDKNKRINLVMNNFYYSDIIEKHSICTFVI